MSWRLIEYSDITVEAEFSRIPSLSPLVLLPIPFSLKYSGQHRVASIGSRQTMAPRTWYAVETQQWVSRVPQKLTLHSAETAVGDGAVVTVKSPSICRIFLGSWSETVPEDTTFYSSWYSALHTWWGVLFARIFECCVRWSPRRMEIALWDGDVVWFDVPVKLHGLTLPIKAEVPHL